MGRDVVHPLDAREDERVYFEGLSRHGTGIGTGAYRRAVRACTGSLPVWARPRTGGPKPKLSVSHDAEPS